MKYLVFILFFFVGGCSATADRHNTNELSISYPLKGTTTAIVGIAVDDKGFPLETVKKVVLRPGDKAIFAGPDSFEIVFKNKKAPNRKVKYVSQNGVIIIAIPADILKTGAYVDEYRKNGFLMFNYSIFINGKELDPPMIIKPDN